MSKTYIPKEVRRDLWFNAHGRCAMCNKPLYSVGADDGTEERALYAEIS